MSIRITHNFERNYNHDGSYDLVATKRTLEKTVIPIEKVWDTLENGKSPESSDYYESCMKWLKYEVSMHSDAYAWNVKTNEQGQVIGIWISPTHYTLKSFREAFHRTQRAKR